MAADLPERFRRARKDSGLAVLEGFHPLKHALRFGAEITEAVAPEPAAVLALARELAPDLLGRLGEVLRPVSAEVFARLAPQPPPTGVLALARRPPFSLPELLAAPEAAPVILLDQPARLGNLGAAVRVAAAAGAAGLLASGRHDPWHPEALRGSAGLHFALPVGGIEALPPDLGRRPLVAIHPEGPPLSPGRVPPRSLLAFGSERGGLTGEILERAEAVLAIPMRPGVSSLNLASAVAVALYVGFATAGGKF